MKERRTAISDSLRTAILTDGRPLRRIAASADVPASTICRFIHRQRGLSSKAFDRVCVAVNWELRPASRSA
jgi:hypothetical protein